MKYHYSVPTFLFTFFFLYFDLCSPVALVPSCVWLMSLQKTDIRAQAGPKVLNSASKSGQKQIAKTNYTSFSLIHLHSPLIFRQGNSQNHRTQNCRV